MSADIVSAAAGTAPEPLRAHCCVVGGGPAGVVLSLLLARASVPVVLLEAHKDFDRDFRGDTIHPSTLELLDQIGLVGRLHALPHSKLREVRFVYPTGIHTMAVFDRLRTRFPFITMMPQSRFLEFLVEEARRYPHFRFVMGANVQQLLERDGVVEGVRYRTTEGWGEVRASLTVGADGRFSRMRKLAAFDPVSQSPRTEVLWFRLPRNSNDRHHGATLHVGCGHVVVLLARMDEWQLGYVVPDGGYQQLKTRGIEAFQRSIAAAVPWLEDRVELLDSWQHVNVLSIEANRLKRWYRSGLLLIGDAAHVMLPVGGVGINYAIADAVESANVLTEPLLASCVRDGDLAEVQRRRAWPTRIIQRLQTTMQKRIIRQALTATKPFRPPLPLRILLRVPGLRDVPARLVAFGVRKVRLESR
jgi:2-polyprenyl-6-methoxyphenol hydroxylase-like FAD-dependent oxidoreductase